MIGGGCSIVTLPTNGYLDGVSGADQQAQRQIDHKPRVDIERSIPIICQVIGQRSNKFERSPAVAGLK